MKIVDVKNGVGPQLIRDTFEGVNIRIKLMWNKEYEFYSLGIVDENDNTLIDGVPVKVGADLIAPYRLDLGGLVVSSPSLSEEMTIDNVGVTHFLVHIPAAEL
jgi:hypothetical protein